MISVWVPCYNEIGNVELMAENLSYILKQEKYQYEIVFNDNCSTDGTKEVLRKLAKRDYHIKVLINNRNYGLTGRSERNSFKYLKGKAIIMIPCDFQEPLEFIPEFLRYWEAGNKVVRGQKNNSEEGTLKYTCRNIFYKIINLFSDVPIKRNASGLTLIDREVFDIFLKTDYEVGLSYALADMGYEVKYVKYIQKARKTGKSHYNFFSSLDYALRMLTSSSQVVLRISTYFGFLIAFVCFLIALVYFVLKMMYWNTFSAGTLPILLGIFFIGALQLVFIGVLGEYVGRIFELILKKPEVILSETINIGEGN